MRRENEKLAMGFVRNHCWNGVGLLSLGSVWSRREKAQKCHPKFKRVSDRGQMTLSGWASPSLSLLVMRATQPPLSLSAALSWVLVTWSIAKSDCVHQKAGMTWTNTAETTFAEQRLYPISHSSKCSQSSMLQPISHTSRSYQSSIKFWSDTHKTYICSLVLSHFLSHTHKKIYTHSCYLRYIVPIAKSVK